MDIFMNAVVMSVFVVVILSLLRVNVLFALIIGSLVAGVLSGISVTKTTELMINGMGNQGETALSYILLGIFAVMISLSGITKLLVKGILQTLSGKRLILVLSIAVIASFSQNLVPIHIAFIPILIPPLLIVFDKMEIDRRAVATALTFGLKFPYITIPFGYGLIFQGIIVEEMIANGMDITHNEVIKAMVFPGMAMIVGLLVAVFITYRKRRAPEAQMRRSAIDVDETVETWNIHHTFTVIAIIITVAVQIMTKSLVLGALAGIIVLFATRVVATKSADKVIQDGITMMGMIAFVMLIASGYASVLKETGAVDSLVETTLRYTGESHIVIAFVLLFVGLVITMGIGTSFGTIPILAALYIPILLAVGMSPIASAALIGTAGALGDAGSPASDSTLGPTSGLNADGRHHHIWDTCVPTFLHYNIPLFIFGVIAVIFL